jgi:RNA polymerase sigma factor (TIGR02999 family)
MSQSVTQLFSETVRGNENAFREFMAAVSPEVLRRARSYARRERRGHSLQGTALFNELYLRLAQGKKNWNNLEHFFAVSSYAMQLILRDHARKRKTEKRGAGVRQTTLTNADRIEGNPDLNPEQTVALAEAMTHLGKQDPRALRVVECRTFEGLSVKDTAEALGVCTKTVRADLVFARAFLAAELMPRSKGL